MKKLVALALLVGCVALTGCMTTTHKVGTGGTGTPKEYREWYVLWGLVPINGNDTTSMAEGASNYTIKTERNILDVVINFFTGAVTVYSQTVTVTK